MTKYQGLKVTFSTNIVFVTTVIVILGSCCKMAQGLPTLIRIGAIFTGNIYVYCWYCTKLLNIR